MTERVVAVLGTRYPDLATEEDILGPLGVRLRVSPGTTRDELLAAADGAEVVLAGSAPRFDADTIAQLTCRGIVRYGIGTDAIDLDAARRHGLWVARVSDYGTEAVGMHAIALVLAGARRLVAANDHVHAGGWGFAHLRPLHLPSASVAGVVGYGRIGRYVAHHLAALGYEVLVHDPFVERVDSGVTLVRDLDALLARSSVVSLHVPGAPDGSPLLGARQLALLRHGSVLVNTARGTLIDHHALVDGLRAGRPGLAALDVHQREPLDPSVFDGVRGSVILTPHMAWYSEESEHDLRVKAAQAAACLLRGERPDDVVVDPTQELP